MDYLFFIKKYGSNLIKKQFLKPLPETNVTKLNDINLVNILIVNLLNFYYMIIKIKNIF